MSFESLGPVVRDTCHGTCRGGGTLVFTDTHGSKRFWTVTGLMQMTFSKERERERALLH